MNTSWTRCSLALCWLLATSAAQPGNDFPVQVKLRVTGFTTGPTQVLLDRDQGKVWQQYLDAKRPDANGIVTFTIYEPGAYWLLATSSQQGKLRRGACLVQVSKSGDFQVKRPPRTKEGIKWGAQERSTKNCGSKLMPVVALKAP